MNFLRKLFGEKSSAAASKEPAQPAGAPGSSSPPRRMDPGGDYALVKGQDGSINGIWVRDPTLAQDGVKLLFLLVKAGIPKDMMTIVAAGYYRIDTQADVEGCFVIWGDVLYVPGAEPPMPPISLFGG